VVAEGRTCEFAEDRRSALWRIGTSVTAKFLGLAERALTSRAVGNTRRIEVSGGNDGRREIRFGEKNIFR
jgi:hypothetical protein